MKPTDRENDSKDDLVRRLADLPRTQPPPRGSEDAVVGALEREGLLHRAAPWRRAAPGPGWLWAALVPLAFFGGLWSGGVSSAEPEPSHILLLHGSALPSGPEAAEARQARFAEHAAWARELRREHRLLAAHPLDAETWQVAAGGDSSVAGAQEAISGYFLIRADSDERAVELARACPHVQHGGVVEVRRLGGGGRGRERGGGR